MRLLIDQDVYAVTIRFLMELGDDVLPVAQLGLARAEDEQLLRLAKEQTPMAAATKLQSPNRLIHDRSLTKRSRKDDIYRHI